MPRLRIVPLLLILLASAGCSGDDASPGPDTDGVWDTQPPVFSREVSMAPFGSYGALYMPTGGDSLYSMASEYTTAVVTVLTYRDGGGGDYMDEEWPALPVFTARVERTATGSLAPEGEVITITQPSGGYRKGVAWDLAEDRLLEVGQRYLLFLRSEQDPNVLRAVQWGKWRINSAGRLERQWDSSTPISYFSEVEGRHIDELFDWIEVRVSP